MLGVCLSRCIYTLGVLFFLLLFIVFLYPLLPTFLIGDNPMMSRPVGGTVLTTCKPSWESIRPIRLATILDSNNLVHKLPGSPYGVTGNILLIFYYITCTGAHKI